MANLKIKTAVLRERARLAGWRPSEPAMAAYQDHLMARNARVFGMWVSIWRQRNGQR